ncbi:hypothetical protein [Gemmata sp.]|uniref:hypothetical protein n=1 Tax=Gemmata sp. TaxID=1914242 RepID=UPI003F706DB8
MLLAPRTLAAALFACLALATAGCGSNNSGKITGKWKLVSAPGLKAEELKMMEALKAFLFFEFKADGNMAVGVEFGDPAMKEAMAKANDKGEKTVMTGQYKLLSGDDVEFSGMNDQKKAGGLFGTGDKSRLKIKIDGDNMTITGSDGVGQLTRVK